MWVLRKWQWGICRNLSEKAKREKKYLPLHKSDGIFIGLQINNQVKVIQRLIYKLFSRLQKNHRIKIYHGLNISPSNATTGTTIRTTKTTKVFGIVTWQNFRRKNFRFIHSRCCCQFNSYTIWMMEWHFQLITENMKGSSKGIVHIGMIRKFVFLLSKLSCTEHEKKMWILFCPPKNRYDKFWWNCINTMEDFWRLKFM